MEFLTQLIELFAKCIRETAVRENLFWAMAVSSALVGLGISALCAFSARLWNKKYHIKPFHYVVSAGAGGFAIICTLLLFSAIHIPDAAQKLIGIWEVKITHDSDWIENQLGRRIFYAVDKIIPQPPVEKRQGQWSTLIPNDSPRAKDGRRAFARVLAIDSLRHFRQNHRYLSWLLWVDKQGPEADIQDRVATEMDRSGWVAYKTALGWTAERVTDDLNRESKRLVVRSRVAIVIVFLVIELLCFGIVGLAAYRDLKVRV